MSSTKVPRHPKGANAHGHYATLTLHYSIPLSAKLLANQLHLQIHPPQAVDFWGFSLPKIPEVQNRWTPLVTDFRQDRTYKELIPSFEKCYSKKIRPSFATLSVISSIPSLRNTLASKKDRKHFILHKCVTPKCPYYLHNLKKVDKEDPKEDHGKNKYKLHYIYREFMIYFSAWI